MVKKNLSRSCLLLGGLLLVGLVGLPLVSGAGSSAQRPIFSGQATVVRASVLDLPAIVLSDTGYVEGSEFAEDATLLEASIPGDATGGVLTLSAEVLHAATVADGERSRSEASIASLDMTVAGSTIEADFLMARAEASCGKEGPTFVGGAELAHLVINGRQVVVVEPNQRVDLPNGHVILNEQTRSVTGNKGAITVNALHVVVKDPLSGAQLADVVISSAHADVTCAGEPPCPNPNDFVTGGGWITGTPSKTKGTFGVAGGIKKNAFWGHLTYIDHGPNRVKVKGTAVTAYLATGPTSRRIEGACEVNGQGGFTYKVDVADNGEPGRDDTFSIKLSNGYAASGNLEGGNIQLHKPCR